MCPPSLTKDYLLSQYAWVKAKTLYQSHFFERRTTEAQRTQREEKNA